MTEPGRKDLKPRLEDAADTPLTSDNEAGTWENGRAGTVAPTTARPLISTTTSTREVRA